MASEWDDFEAERPLLCQNFPDELQISAVKSWMEGHTTEVV